MCFGNKLYAIMLFFNLMHYFFPNCFNFFQKYSIGERTIEKLRFLISF